MAVTSTSIDLHLHSTSSDGKLSPTAVVELAAQRGLDLIALTDHDTLHGIAEAQEAGRRLGVAVRPGIEVSGKYTGGQCHLLIWLPDPGPAPFVEWTHEKERDRETRAREMVERLQAHGSQVTWEQVRTQAANNIGRPHVADALIAVGEATDRRDAFTTKIGNDCPAYVPSGKTEPTAVIERAVAAGALVSLAHPYSLRLEGADLDAYVAQLAEAGLGAIEAHRGDQDAAEQAAYHALAQRHGLLVSVGSDFHDFDREEPDAVGKRRGLGWGGDPGISASDVEALLSRLPGARDALAG
jgi:predicted metal-dependent phosphoesterase TrpH